MLYLGTGRRKNPPELQLDVLHQVTGQLHVPYIRRMIERADIIMLKDACSVEVMHKAAVTRRPVIEIFVNLLDLLDKGPALLVSVAYSAEPVPKGDQDDLRSRPNAVNFVDELDIGVEVLITSDVVGSVVVIRAKVDDDNVGGRMGCEVPEFRGRAPLLDGAVGGVRCTEPLVGLQRLGELKGEGRIRGK